MTTDRPAGRGFAGESRRGPALLDEHPIGPWRGRVKVVPLELRRGVRFEVYVEWTGPPPLGFPPLRAGEPPSSSSDVYVADDLELARAIARHAASELRRPEVPDLRGVAAQLRDRLAAGPYG